MDVGHSNGNCEWAVKGEVLYHWTISDYLDDVSGAIADRGDATADFYSDPEVFPLLVKCVVILLGMTECGIST